MATDRDIAIRLVADGDHPNTLTLAAIYNEELLTVTPTTPLSLALALMRENAIRRIHRHRLP